MALPAKRQRQTIDTGRDKRDRCPGHLNFVRGHECSVPGCKEMPIEAAHVRCGTDGGMGMKPSDCWAISLCSAHHAEQHRIGEPAFEAKHLINMKSLAKEFAAASLPWRRYLAKKAQENG